MKHITILIICILTTAVFADTVKYEFTLKDLEKLRKEAKEAEECVPDCLMKRSDVEKKMGMSNKGTCVDLCRNGRTGNEMYGRVCDVCRYEKKFGRKMYAITIKYSIWDGVSHAESFDWKEIDEKVEDTSAKDPDPDRDGICSPWVSQNGVMDKYGALCMGIDKCPNQAGSVNSDGCPD
jgi:hypothetical protein